MGIVHRCPKCGTTFDPPRPMESECPHCCIWFHKVLLVQPNEDSRPKTEVRVGVSSWRDPRSIEKIVSPHGALLLFLTIWGIRLSITSYQDAELAESFMHMILLPIHEAGHIFLIPLGEFMTVLGGSLFQVALPLGIGVAFLIRQHDPFGASVCLWWVGASLVDLSPYVWDSLHPQLTLLGGHTGEVGGHDWIYLLERAGALKYAHFWGSCFHHIGALTMVVGICWGIFSLLHADDVNLSKLTAP